MNPRFAEPTRATRWPKRKHRSSDLKSLPVRTPPPADAAPAGSYDSIRSLGPDRAPERHARPVRVDRLTRSRRSTSLNRGLTEGALVGEPAVLLAGRIRSPTAGAEPVPGPVLTLRMEAHRFPVSPVHCCGDAGDTDAPRGGGHAHIRSRKAASFPKHFPELPRAEPTRTLPGW
jgi:hypothetical protein